MRKRIEEGPNFVINATPKEHCLLDPQDVERLSQEWSVPKEDVLLIALNASGVKYQGVENDRGRFVATFPNGRQYLLALTISNNPFSPFELIDGSLLFDGEVIATTSEMEKDTCTDSYWRGDKKHLTLNSNSRSNCKGCAFCGTYSLEDDDKALTKPEALRRKAQLLHEALQEESRGGLSSLESVGVVTGCFPNEEKLVEHLMMIREVFSEFGFDGEIRYIGSQLRSFEAMKRVIESGPFALYLTVEAFDRRDQLMKRTKASLDLESGKKVLQQAKDLGAETSFLYIAGLDSHETMEEQFKAYAPVLTRLPQIQTFQAYVPKQTKLRRDDAGHIEYFLRARKIVEEAFPYLLPIAENNFRSLWYTRYADTELPNVKI